MAKESVVKKRGLAWLMAGLLAQHLVHLAQVLVLGPRLLLTLCRAVPAATTTIVVLCACKLMSLALDLHTALNGASAKQSQRLAARYRSG